MDKLLEIGSITEEAAGFLMKLVQAKYNIFISGGTGSGKTTFLNALSEYIPSEERIIVIEDAAELQIREFLIWSGWRSGMPISKAKMRLPFVI